VLERGVIAGAALDAYVPSPRDSIRFRRLTNLIATPIGYVTEDTLSHLYGETVDNIRLLPGRHPSRVIGKVFTQYAYTGIDDRTRKSFPRGPTPRRQDPAGAASSAHLHEPLAAGPFYLGLALAPLPCSTTSSCGPSI